MANNAWDIFYSDYAGRHFPDGVIEQLGHSSHSLVPAFSVMNNLFTADGQVRPDSGDGQAIYEKFCRQLEGAEAEGLSGEAKVSVASAALRFLTDGLRLQVDMPMGSGMDPVRGMMIEGLHAAQHWDQNLQDLPMEIDHGGEAPGAGHGAGGFEPPDGAGPEGQPNVPDHPEIPEGPPGGPEFERRGAEAP